MIRAQLSSEVGKSPLQENLPKIEVFVPSLVLFESNYRYWSMKMTFHPDAQGIWEVALGTEVNRKKDRQALLIILNLVLESYAL